MKTKNKIISLIVSVSMCLVALFNAVYFRDENIKVHDTVLNRTEVDYMSMLEEFDEKEIRVEENNVSISATQYIEDDFFNMLDNLSLEANNDVGSINYDIEYDGNKSIFILKTIVTDKYGNVTTTETEGVPFIDADGEIDAVFIDDEGNVLLSELTGGNIDNCGLFSRLKKALKAIAVAAVVVAVAAVVVAAVVYCPVAAPALAVAGTSITTTTVAAGSATAVAAALTTAAVAGTVAVTAGAASDAINAGTQTGTIDLSKKIADIKSTISKITIGTITCAIYKQLTALINEALGEVYFIMDNIQGTSANIYLKAVDRITAAHHMMQGGDVFTLEKQDAITVIRNIGGVYAANSAGVANQSEVDLKGILPHFHPYSSTLGKMKYNGKSVHSFYFKETKSTKVC